MRASSRSRCSADPTTSQCELGRITSWSQELPQFVACEPRLFENIMQCPTCDLTVHRNDRPPLTGGVNFFHRDVTTFLTEDNEFNFLARFDEFCAGDVPAACSYGDFDFRELRFANRALYV